MVTVLQQSAFFYRLGWAARWLSLNLGLYKRLEEKAMLVAGNAKNRPRNSLIGRLRIRLRGNDPDGAIETLRVWLGSSESGGLKSPAMKQIEDCEIEGVRLNYWLLKAMDPNEVWNWLDGDSQLRRYSLGSDIPQKSIVIKTPAALSVKFIDVVLATMAVLNKTRLE